jgi:hypothetical protein
VTPSWVSVERGPAPLVLVAPHGGRRHERRHPGKHKVNDLWTAALTRELAAATGATAIVNDSRDRNEVDLNRLSQVVRDAPWFLALLADVVSTIVADAGHATVLVIHGWNVTQPACDVGVGLRDEPTGCVPVRPDAATVSPEFVATRLQLLRRAAAADGIAVTIGSRYPAAHPNNLLQVFRHGADTTTVEGPLATLAALCRRGAVDAAQLELAIPLRWPGRRRDRFAELLAETFARPMAPAPRRAPRETSPIYLGVHGGRLTRRLGVQVIQDELVLMGGVDAGDAGALGGRLLLSTSHDRLALFTGELSDASRPWCIPPLELCRLASGAVELRFDGAVVEFPVLTPFLDLERGLADGRLLEARVALTFTPDDDRQRSDDRDERFGDVRGAIDIGDAHHDVATRGVLTDVARLTVPRLPWLRLTLPGGPFGAITLTADPEEPLVVRERGQLTGTLVGRDGRTGTLRGACEVHWSSTAGTIALALAIDGQAAAPLAGHLERLIPVRRPGRDGAVIEATYAVVRFATGDVGWAEIAVIAPGIETPLVNEA